MRIRLYAAATAALMHLLGSILVVALAGVLIFSFWYPFPYSVIEGGRKLFLIGVAVNVICGPLLTAVIFDPAKRRQELARDVAIVVLLQFAALAYGIYAVAVSRPVFLAFERDRFRIVSAGEINQEDLPKALPAYQALSLLGPRLVAVHVPEPSEPDYLKSLELSLGGIETSVRPSQWRPYNEQRELVKHRLQSLSQLKQRRVESRAQINDAIKDAHVPEASLGYLPVVGRRGLGWIALVSRDDARILGFAEVDGF